MSHFTTITTEIFDFDILKQTISDFGFTMHEDDKLIGHNGQFEYVNLSIRVAPKSYVGFKEEAPGKGYVITGMVETLTEEKTRRIIQMIRQEYAYRKVLHETRKRGFSLVQEQRVKAGVIKLVLKKVA